MFPLHKLERLPRHQRLRKIAKVFTEAENRLCTAQLPADEYAFFAAVAELLQKDPLFNEAAQAAFAEAAAILRNAPDIVNDYVQTRRALNTVRHILITETGRSQADWDFIDTAGNLDSAQRRPFPGMFVYLEDIRSPFNVGAMFRTAETFGVEKILLSPLCADPRHPRSLRSAMGCIDVLPWERCDLPVAVDVPLFALETGGTPLDEFQFPKKGILIAGSEELGVSPKALAAADASLGRVTIPCYGAKRSLNVSVAFGIVMQAWAQHLCWRRILK